MESEVCLLYNRLEVQDWDWEDLLIISAAIQKENKFLALKAVKTEPKKKQAGHFW